jgi:hypothetical protein
MAYRPVEELIAGMMAWSEDTAQGRLMVKLVDIHLRSSDASNPSKVQHLLTWATPEILLELSKGRSQIRGEIEAMYVERIRGKGFAYSLTASMRVFAGYMVAHGNGGYNDE